MVPRLKRGEGSKCENWSLHLTKQVVLGECLHCILSMIVESANIPPVGLVVKTKQKKAQKMARIFKR